MKAILQRDRAISDKAVFGHLTLTWNPGASAVYTAEPFQCIPAGIYNLIGHQGHKTDVWELQDVPGHTGILIHAGNFPADTTWNDEPRHADSQGCILVGFGMLAKVPMLLRSQDALEYLRHIFGVKPQGVPMNITLDVRD